MTNGFLSFEDVDEDWIRRFFIEPLIAHAPSRTIIIIDGLDLTKHDLLRPLIRLAFMLQAIQDRLPLRIFLTTHPYIRTRTEVRRNIVDARVLKEFHVIYPLEKLPQLSSSQIEIKQVKRTVQGQLKYSLFHRTPSLFFRT